MAKASKRKIVRTKVLMHANVAIAVGDMLLYPYNIEVVAGEPSAHKKFHVKYHDQECMVIGLRKVSDTSVFARLANKPGQTRTLIKVRFADGAEEEFLPRAFVYIGRKKPAKTPYDSNSPRPIG